MKKYVKSDIDMTYYSNPYPNWDDEESEEDLAKLTTEEKNVLDYNDYVLSEYLITFNCISHYLQDYESYKQELENYIYQHTLPEDAYEITDLKPYVAKEGYMTVPQNYIDNIKTCFKNILDWVEHFEDKLDQ